MMNYLKNQGTWKLSQLKNLCFEEVKEEFDKLVKQVGSFAPINFEATKDSLKRFSEELQTKTSKRLKSDEAKDDEPTKKTGKRRKQMARKGLHTDLDKDDSEDSDEASEQDDSASGTKIPINPVPVAMKSPSIVTYKIIKQGERGVYQIVREDGTDIVYINFGAMLKDITRDDLTELYRIVMNRYGMNGPEDELEKVLWGYLRNMFEEPLRTDLFWRQYPVSPEVCKVMLDKKLQGGKPDEDCYKLLKWMEKQAGIRKYTKNIDTIIYVLKCFHRASGLIINLSKSKLLGVVVSEDRVVQAANKIGCGVHKAPFAYLGSKVGGNMSRIKSWDEIVDKMVDRANESPSTNGINSKSVFSGVDLNSKKSIWVKWSKVLCSKEKGGLGVSSLYALNRALMCKWVWRFTTQKNLLWTRVIKAIHGEDGKNGSGFKVGYKSIWRIILQEVETLKIKDIHLNNFMHKKLGNGADTYFWEDLWHGDMVLKQRYPRLYALEVKKTVDVTSKLSQENLTWFFRRAPRSGVKQDQLTDLTTYVEGVVLGVTPDRWYWTLDGSGEFSVASARKVIDDNRFSEVSTQTRWIKAVPIKVNIHAWKVRMDCLSTRLNISRRGIDIPSILCPVCGSVTESSSHLFFDCLVAKDNFRKICRWWEVDFMEVHTFDEWVSWIVNLRIPIKHKRLLEGVTANSLELHLLIDFSFDRLLLTIYFGLTTCQTCVPCEGILRHIVLSIGSVSTPGWAHGIYLLAWMGWNADIEGRGLGELCTYDKMSLEHEKERVTVTFEALWRPVLALESWAGQTDAQRAAMWHAISDTQGENRELRLQLTEERRVGLELAEIVDSMRRGKEPRGYMSAPAGRPFRCVKSKVVAEMAAIGFGLPKDAFTGLLKNGPHLLSPCRGVTVRDSLTCRDFPGLYIWQRNEKRVKVKVREGCLLILSGKQSIHRNGSWKREFWSSAPTLRKFWIEWSYLVVSLEGDYDGRLRRVQDSRYPGEVQNGVITGLHRFHFIPYSLGIICRKMRNGVILPTPVFWLGSRTKSVTAAMAGMLKSDNECFPKWEEAMDSWGYELMSAVEVVAEMTAIGFGLPKDAFTDLLKSVSLINSTTLDFDVFFVLTVRRHQHSLTETNQRCNSN
ncbi:RNA-directed DNA polymerase, eukaryota, reverse transcriptase zinc-binding domain protein [Tanacetum coccineum]